VTEELELRPISPLIAEGPVLVTVLVTVD